MAIIAAKGASNKYCVKGLNTYVSGTRTLKGGFGLDLLCIAYICLFNLVYKIGKKCNHTF